MDVVDIIKITYNSSRNGGIADGRVKKRRNLYD